MSDHEQNTIDEHDPGTSKAASTDSAAQHMPSVNAFAGVFTAALAPGLSQLTNLKENMSSLLLNGQDDSDEDGETASNDGAAKSADIDADLSALLISGGKDNNNVPIPGEDLLNELAKDLTVSEKTSPPLREGLAAIFNNVLSEKMGTRSLRPNWTNILVQRMSRVCKPRKSTLQSGVSSQLP